MAATIDQVMEGYDIMTISQDQYVKMFDQLNRMEGQHTKQHIQKAIGMLQKQVAVPNFPGHLDQPTFAAKKILNEIISNAKEVGCLNDVYPDLFEFVLACFNAKLTKGSIEFMKEFVFEMKTYFKPLQDPDLSRLFTAMKQDYQPYAADFVRKFSGDFTSAEPGDVLERCDPYADFFLYCMTQLETQDKAEVAMVYSNMICDIKRKFTQGYHKPSTLYMKLKKPETLKEHLAAYNKIVADKDFPHHKDTAGHAEDWMKAMYQPLTNKLPYGVALLQDFMDTHLKLLAYPTEAHQSMANRMGYLLRDLDKEVKKNATIDGNLLVQVMEKPTKNLTNLAQVLRYGVEQSLGTPEGFKAAVPALCKFIQTLDAKTLDETKHTLEEGTKKLKVHWKNLGPELDALLQCAVETAVANPDADSWKLRRFDNIVEWIIEKAEKGKVLNQLNATLIKGTLLALDPSAGRFLLDTVENFVEHAVWEGEWESLRKALGLVVDKVKKADIDDEVYCYQKLLMETVFKGFDQITTAGVGEKFAEIARDLLVGTAPMILEEDIEGARCIYQQLPMAALTFGIKNCNSSECVRPLVPAIMKLLECSDDSILSCCKAVMMTSVKSQPETWEPVTAELIQLCAEEKNWEYLNVLNEIYPCGADHVHKHIDQFVDALSRTDSAANMYAAMLLKQVATNAPQVFDEKHVTKLSGQMTSETMRYMVFQLLTVLSEKRPSCVAGQLEALYSVALSGDPPTTVPLVTQIFSNLGTQNEKQATKVLAKLFDILNKVPASVQQSVLAAIRTVGIHHQGALATWKSSLTQLTENPQTQEVSQYLIDVLEGRTLASLSEEVTEQREELDQVKGDVAETNQNVDTLTTKVGRAEKDIDHIKEDVTKAEERLDDVEETVDETVGKVEELDHKTMTNAPAWSRDVSRLLNPEAEHDWRLLAQRLGYSNKDIRGWATQNDPCMAVLSEWYATHKTSEATHGVLKALEELNREDAAQIVRNALANAEGVVEDAADDSGPLPPVFLSYQWGHQAHAKLLRRHLEAAGFRCWMDLGQMGGGDKLFAKIDAGMRAAAVVICCVTEQYAKSDNCNREVNLAVTVGKPIIPLVMEKMAWPPEGAMGPIFGEYLFIRFHQRSGEGAGDERFWPPPKFQELLLQLRYHIVPDESLVTDEYKNWWKPKEESIVIPKESNKANSGRQDGAASATQDAVSAEGSGPPEVFISYQWGKQPQIHALYQKLTSIGFRCWMDINQMGGGDSLYDKIDKGVRGCKVVVACVTTKYSLSANCRREVSLADALKKPVVPLLLEDITWPPEGPMSMVFTQLLYIGFHDDPTVQNTWHGPKFDELVAKLNAIMSPVTSSPTSGSASAQPQPAVSKETDRRRASVTSNKGTETTPRTKSVAALQRPLSARPETSMSRSKSCVLL